MNANDALGFLGITLAMVMLGGLAYVAAKSNARSLPFQLALAIACAGAAAWLFGGTGAVETETGSYDGVFYAQDVVDTESLSPSERKDRRLGTFMLLAAGLSVGVVAGHKSRGDA